MLQLDNDGRDGLAAALIAALVQCTAERDRLAGECWKYQIRIKELTQQAADNYDDYADLRDGTGRFAPARGRVEIRSDRGLFTPDGGGSQ